MSILTFLAICGVILFLCICVLPFALLFSLLQQPAQVQIPPTPAPMVQEYHAPAGINCAPTNAEGQPLLGHSDTECWYMKAPAEMPAASDQTDMQEYSAPTTASNGYDAYQGTESCVDGSSLDNVYADISRIPLGNREGASVYEISLTGNGTGGYFRFILIEERMNSQTMGFVKDSRTVHGLRYCGTLQSIMNYAPTHVDAMVQSAQDDQGARPDPREIPIILLKNDGTFVVVRDAPLWPGFLETIKNHVLMTVN